MKTISFTKEEIKSLEIILRRNKRKLNRKINALNSNPILTLEIKEEIEEIELFMKKIS